MEIYGKNLEKHLFLFSSSMTPDEFNQDSEDVFVNPIFENESCHWTDHEYETASWVNDIFFLLKIYFLKVC